MVILRSATRANFGHAWHLPPDPNDQSETGSKQQAEIPFRKTPAKRGYRYRLETAEEAFSRQSSGRARLGQPANLPTAFRVPRALPSFQILSRARLPAAVTPHQPLRSGKDRLAPLKNCWGAETEKRSRSPNTLSCHRYNVRLLNFEA